jgi:hypothetical protein
VVLQKAIFTGGRKGNEATDVGSHQISKPAPLLPLMAKTPTTLRDLLFKTKHRRVGKKSPSTQPRRRVKDNAAYPRSRAKRFVSAIKIHFWMTAMAMA